MGFKTFYEYTGFETSFFTQHLTMLTVKNTSQIRFFGTILKKGERCCNV